MYQAIEDAIIKELDVMSGNFSDGELANYAMTTNCERPFQDRLAFYLSSRLSNNPKTKNHIAIREWYHRDIAILDLEANSIDSIIELKAGYTYDAITKADTYYPNLARVDTDKVKNTLSEKNQKGECSIYTLLLLTHPFSNLINKHDGVITYRKSMQRCINKLGNHEAVLDTAKINIAANFEDFNLIHQGNVRAGRFLDIEVDVLFWLFKTG